MKHSCFAVLFAVALLTAAIQPPADAAAKYKPCSLLTNAEIGGVLGSKVVTTREGDFDAQGVTMSNCTWATASPIIAAQLFVGRIPPGAEAKARDSIAQTSKMFDDLKKKGGTVQVAVNTPGLWCARIVQPPGDSSPPQAMCSGMSKGYIMTIQLSSQTATGQHVKGLFDKAVSRLR
jgi:hypothetical protein